MLNGALVKSVHEKRQKKNQLSKGQRSIDGGLRDGNGTGGGQGGKKKQGNRRKRPRAPEQHRLREQSDKSGKNARQNETKGNIINQKGNSGLRDESKKNNTEEGKEEKKKSGTGMT